MLGKVGKGRPSYCWDLTDGRVGWEIRGQGMESGRGEVGVGSGVEESCEQADQACSPVSGDKARAAATLSSLLLSLVSFSHFSSSSLDSGLSGSLYLIKSILYGYGCFPCCLSVHHVCTCAFRGQKRTSGSLTLEIPMVVVSCAGN